MDQVDIVELLMAGEAACGLAGEAAGGIVGPVRLPPFAPGVIGQPLNHGPGFIGQHRH